MDQAQPPTLAPERVPGYGRVLRVGDFHGGDRRERSLRGGRDLHDHGHRLPLVGGMELPKRPAVPATSHVTTTSKP